MVTCRPCSEPAQCTADVSHHCNIAGVLDVTSQAVTHAVAARSGPTPPAQNDTTLPAVTERLASHGQLTRPRKGAWSGCGGSFLVPAMTPQDSLPAVAAHDFGHRSRLSRPLDGAPPYAARAECQALAEKQCRTNLTSNRMDRDSTSILPRLRS